MGSDAYYSLDYGYTCRYNREVKKRGRAPTSSTTEHNAEKVPSVDPVSTSTLPSPEASSQPSQVRPSHETHRSSFTSPHSQLPSGDDGGRPSISHIVTQPSPASIQQPGYLASPVCSSGHSQMHLSSLLEATTDILSMKSAHANTPSMFTAGRAAEAEAVASDDSVGYPSPAAGGPPPLQQGRNFRGRESFSTQGPPPTRDRYSMSTSSMRESSVTEYQRAQISLYKAPSADCRYRCLDPILPYLRDIIPASVACDLLDVYLTEPGSSLFRCASPYILTRIFRKKSLLHPTNPRQTTPALLATMLWCSAQTADIVLLHVPGSRAKICNALYELATALITDRDADRWRRTHGKQEPLETLFA